MDCTDHNTTLDLRRADHTDDTVPDAEHKVKNVNTNESDTPKISDDEYYVNDKHLINTDSDGTNAMTIDARTNGKSTEVENNFRLSIDEDTSVLPPKYVNRFRWDTKFKTTGLVIKKRRTLYVNTLKPDGGERMITTLPGKLFGISGFWDYHLARANKAIHTPGLHTIDITIHTFPSESVEDHIVIGFAKDSYNPFQGTNKKSGQISKRFVRSSKCHCVVGESDDSWGWLLSENKIYHSAKPSDQNSPKGFEWTNYRKYRFKFYVGTNANCDVQVLGLDGWGHENDIGVRFFQLPTPIWLVAATSGSFSPITVQYISGPTEFVKLLSTNGICRCVRC
ncbi:unnamed protein product [Owenia fusiformis]|uniref:Uncharacterized protein n=1 Tax=Owenia fusiformis TaxID=6347 RepID=A0A8J1THU0_OWEFU|nr:unnamed protein product [Owenia fusiformis]